MNDTGVRVVEPGRTFVQDSGRFGYQKYGVSVRGSSDQYSAAIASALVANDGAAPLLELTGLDLTVQTVGDLLIAVTGADCDFTVDGHRVPISQPVAVPGGSIIRVSHIHHGLRCYLAVHGRIVAPTLLGSVAPDPGLGFGWALAKGHFVRIRSAFAHFDHPHLRHPLMRPLVPERRITRPTRVAVTVGPEWDEFRDAREALRSNEFTVGNDSDEVGLRLVGSAPSRSVTHELRSRGVGIGAIEVTPAGDLIALLRGRLLTAGYPVVVVATTAALSTLGQLQPGDAVRFDVVTLDEAIRTAEAQRRAVDGVEHRVRTILGSIDGAFPGVN